MVDKDDFDLEPGQVYSASELRSIFNRGRAGLGIEICYDENEQKYLRLFSSPHSEYGDDLDADPMRYVGEKDFNNPDGDQVANRGNGALIQSQSTTWPIFLFDKVSDQPVKHRFIGNVEVVDVEHNTRPSKEKKEYDFYLRRVDSSEIETEVDEGVDSDDDLAPGPLREINPGSVDVPDSERDITYESNRETQATATNEHENAVGVLSRWLQQRGWDTRETDETDVFALTEDEALVLEVKSVNGRNDGDQIRRAVGQLFENSYRDVNRRGYGDKETIRCLGFSQPPSDEYSGYLEYLRHLGIEVLWLNDENNVTGIPESVQRLGGAEQR